MTLWKEFAGSLIVGTKGMLLGGGHSATAELLPADQFKDAQKDSPERLLGSQGPERDWVRAAKGEKVTPMSSFSLAGPYMEMMLLANVATLCEGEFEYDPLAEAKPGGSVSFDTVWTFGPLGKAVTEPKDAKGLRRTIERAIR